MSRLCERGVGSLGDPVEVALHRRRQTGRQLIGRQRDEGLEFEDVADDERTGHLGEHKSGPQIRLGGLDPPLLALCGRPRRRGTDADSAMLLSLAAAPAPAGAAETSPDQVAPRVTIGRSNRWMTVKIAA